MDFSLVADRGDGIQISDSSGEGSSYVAFALYIKKRHVEINGRPSAYGRRSVVMRNCDRCRKNNSFSK